MEITQQMTCPNCQPRNWTVEELERESRWFQYLADELRKSREETTEQEKP